jgi:hypothetical protein
MPFDGTTFAIPKSSLRRRIVVAFRSTFGADAKTLRVLRRAKTLIENPDNWLQDKLREGNRRCALGALIDATKNMMSLCAAQNEILYVCATRGFVAIEHMNDCGTHTEVVSAFDAAIDRVCARICA